MAETAQAQQPQASADEIGALPVWDLSDLYPGIDAPEVGADLDRAAAEAAEFEAQYKGSLAALAAADDGGARLAEAIAGYERISELLGRLMSYAGLVYAGDTSDPVRSKFYGDLQDRAT
ncbi:MAG TPA: oligoendopeptidase F, partial [Afifellaceae bacterium]|nr:oligoendopeptidase F [Afifellaceae bacterium]